MGVFSNFLSRLKGTPQVWEVILNYNNSLGFFALTNTFANPLKGTLIHKIVAAQAKGVAARVKEVAIDIDQDFTFLMACIAEESTFDPLCQNGNFLGSNPTKELEGYDMGCCQLKLKYLMAEKGIDVTRAQLFAFNVDSAINYFGVKMAGHLAWANKFISEYVPPAEGDARKPVDPRLLQQPLLLATGAYNFGEEGMEAVANLGEFPSHCQQVADLTDSFRTKLGLPKLFPGISKP